jgi:biotin operon repressor
MTQNAWTPEEIEYTLTARDRGKTVREIATTLGRSAAAVEKQIQKVRRDAGESGTPGRPVPPWPEEKIARLLELVAAEVSFSRIGKELGVTKNAIVGKLHRHPDYVRRENPVKARIAPPVAPAGYDGPVGVWEDEDGVIRYVPREPYPRSVNGWNALPPEVGTIPPLRSVWENSREYVR